jgi:hypothetical protein
MSFSHDSISADLAAPRSRVISMPAWSKILSPIKQAFARTQGGTFSWNLD